MSNSSDPFPKTTDECTRILKLIILSIESPFSYRRMQAQNLLDQLYERRCKKALKWLNEKYHTHPMPHIRLLARKAREYESKLDR